MFNLWYYFVLCTVSAANFSANLNTIPVLTGTNFKSWKENVMIVLDCMDLDLALRKDKPPALTDESSTMKLGVLRRINFSFMFVLKLI